MILNQNRLKDILREKSIFFGLILPNKLDLRGNQITKIEKDAFHGLNNLTLLYLAGNKITKIEKDAFLGLNKLSKIYLHCNNIKTEFLNLSLESAVELLSWTSNNNYFKTHIYNNNFSNINFLTILCKQ